MKLHFENESDMLEYLLTYREYYYELSELEKEIGVHSPSQSGDGGHQNSSKISQYNRNIERRDELESRMKEVELVIEKLRPIDNQSYVIMYYKFIRIMSLESIAIMMHISKSTVSYRYRIAKKKLFEICM